MKGEFLTAALCLASVARADALSCNLTEYKPLTGLTATPSGDDLTITWEGTRTQPLRLRFAIENGTPVIEELALRPKNGAWATLLSHARPEFRVVSGLRRMTNQQLDPLAGLGIKITPEILDKYKWEAFWDAPLNIPGTEPAHNDCTPPQRGVLNQPGLPRSPSEVQRASAIYHAQSCSVKTNGARLEISFPGVQLGVFEGRLQFTVYRGSSLIRMEMIAVTHEPSVAYKYDAGIDGIAIGRQSRAGRESRIVWHDPADRFQEYRFGGPSGNGPITVTANNRIVTAELPNGGIAAFPPPHNFFWAREISYNLGYDWYRQDDESSFSFGVRQAEKEADLPGSEDRSQNFALRDARPGTEQRMPIYFYAGLGTAEQVEEEAAAFTRHDHFQALPGYEVMATHFHMGLVGKTQTAGGPQAKVSDLEVLRAAGVNIVAPIDGGAGGGAEGPGGGRNAGGGRGGEAPVDNPRWMQWTRGLGAPPPLILDEALAFTGVSRSEIHFPVEERNRPPRGARGTPDPYRSQAIYYETAKRQSDQNFVVMANTELMRGEIPRNLGGHSDLLISHPVYWTQGRAPGQPLVEDNPTYGHIYHLGDVADMMEMTHRENLLIYMPHPDSKGSTGFPEAIKDTAHFNDENYRGIGFRWGMGLDGSEQRLCEYRCLPLWDDMNNWVADRPTPAKYIQAISEIYGESYGDDVYANNPVNYVKLDRLPPPGEWGPIINSMKNGEYFVTSGEVLISSYSVKGSGAQRTISADVEWTFPLEFVEVVWGDGKQTGRRVISTTDLPPLGKNRFEIPFDASGKKWVRFAARDSAGNGAMEQPVKLSGVTAPGTAR
jgi:hypothetical protein